MNHQIMNMNETAITQKSAKSLVSTKVLFICLAVVALAITAVTIFKVSVGSLFFIAALLACPLMHIFMMKGMHKHE